MRQNLNKAIDFLDQAENTKAFSYFDITCKSEAVKVSTIFPAAFKLHSLAFANKFIKDQNIESVIQNLIKVIVAQERDFSYNYFLRQEKTKLPDDLDSSSLVYSALFLATDGYKPEYFMKAMNLETRIGGPYRTWCFRDRKWDEVDPIINAHFFYFSSLCKIRLPKLKKYLIPFLNESKNISKYYTSNLYLQLYLSKSFYYSKDKNLKTHILLSLNRHDISKLNWWEKFLIFLSKLYLNASISEKDLEEVLNYQRNDGSFELFPLTVDYPIDGKITYTTSKEFTTSLFTEFLVLIEQNKKKKNSSDNYYNEVMSRIQEDASKDKLLKTILRKIKKKPATKPILLPYLLLQDLKQNQKLSHNESQTIKNISIAGLYGWTAFTMLDDYIDNKSFNEEPILISNALRWQYKYLSLLRYKVKWNEFLITETQYLNEFRNYNLKNFNKQSFSTVYIAKRMHIFTCILSEIVNIFNIKKVKREDIYKSLTSLMIIDQLNDDLRDWREDVKNNIITFVTFLVKKHNIKTEKRFFYFLSPLVFKEIDKHFKIANTIVIKYNLTNLKYLLDKSYKPIAKVKIEIANLKKLN